MTAFKKTSLLLAFVVCLITSCKKNNEIVVTDVNLKDSAFAILNRQMHQNDYNRLDWDNAEIIYYKNKPFLIEIPDRLNKAQHLVFAYTESKAVFLNSITIPSTETGIHKTHYLRVNYNPNFPNLYISKGGLKAE